MAPRKLERIRLKPLPNDLFPLTEESIAKSQFQELFTFNGWEVEQLDQTKNHPDLNEQSQSARPGPDNQDASTKPAFSATGSRPFSEPNNAPLEYLRSEDQGSEDRNQGQAPGEATHLRPLVLPGKYLLVDHFFSLFSISPFIWVSNSAADGYQKAIPRIPVDYRATTALSLCLTIMARINQV